MSSSLERRVAGALDPLGWTYEEGDDGDTVLLALDEALSILRRYPELRRSSAERIDELLRDRGCPDETTAPIERLYDVCQQGSYGQGLGASAASELNELAPDVQAIVELFVRRLVKSSEKRAVAAKGKTTKSKSDRRRAK